MTLHIHEKYIAAPSGLFWPRLHLEKIDFSLWRPIKTSKSCQEKPGFISCKGETNGSFILPCGSLLFSAHNDKSSFIVAGILNAARQNSNRVDFRCPVWGDCHSRNITVQ